MNTLKGSALKLLQNGNVYFGRICCLHHVGRRGSHKVKIGADKGKESSGLGL
jgi:hypothetical protein